MWECVSECGHMVMCVYVCEELFCDGVLVFKTFTLLQRNPFKSVPPNASLLDVSAVCCVCVRME